VLIIDAEPSDVFTVSFYESVSGHIHGAQLTHENITAGVFAVRALLPVSNPFSPLDTITSAHSMSTAYGRAIAYTAIYENTSFASIPTSEIFHPDESEFSLAPKNVFVQYSKKRISKKKVPKPSLPESTPSLRRPSSS